ncbi:MAG TPA: iron chelate uptake ABC transporter family permease subunit [Clostridiaceae bacterium]|nr:iron chelate uptake ABC transporter family permease subunit [Clostridiaceae bacterium]
MNRNLSSAEKNNRNAETQGKKLMSILPVMLLLLAASVVVATAVGDVYIPFSDTVRIILKKWGLLKNIEFSYGHEAIIFNVRFPRVITAVLVGGALAASGTAMQGMFRNPMADPGLIGVSSGASLGAVTAVALGLTVKSLYFMPVLAAFGAAITALVIYLLAARDKKVPVLTLVLAGIAVGTFISSVTSMILMSLHQQNQIKEFLFWSIGGLNDRRWEHVKLIALPVIICVLIMMFFSKDLNILLLGEEEAQSLGLDPVKARRGLLFLASAATASAISVGGNISFVGLIVPHIMRLILGPDHRVLLPASFFGGSVFLILCDIIGRVMFPVEVNAGIITSLVGAPYFLYLLIMARKGGNLL